MAYYINFVGDREAEKQRQSIDPKIYLFVERHGKLCCLGSTGSALFEPVYNLFSELNYHNF